MNRIKIRFGKDLIKVGFRGPNFLEGESGSRDFGSKDAEARSLERDLLFLIF
jgi:hypothetical protein